MNKNSIILITGSKGMLGSSLCFNLKKNNYKKLLTPDSSDLDLLDLRKIKVYFAKNNPKYIFHLANRVFGLGGNQKFKFQMLNDNIIINSNLLKVSEEFKVKKIVFAGSSAVYAGNAIFNKKEKDFFLQHPHISEFDYALSKRIMLNQLESLRNSSNIDYSYAILNNIYGNNDNFNIKFGHVIPSLIHKTYIAKKTNKNLILWGTGNEKRSFIHSKDASNALIKIMKSKIKLINVSGSEEYTIKQVADLIANHLKFNNKIKWNKNNLGVRRRHLNIDQLIKKLKFKEKYNLNAGLKNTIDWFTENYKNIRK